ncbi:MAG: CNNM domain-containing protein, partial [Thermoanaerobaculia bacterium]
MEAILLLGLILLNGLFAMSEVALLTARRPRLAKLAADGDMGAAAALALAGDPTRFLSAIQIGITSIAILSGILGENVLAQPLAA